MPRPTPTRAVSRVFIRGGLAVALLLSLLSAPATIARPLRALDETSRPGVAPTAAAPSIYDLGNRIHDVGQLALRVTNVGTFGANWFFWRAPYPSAEWPAGTAQDYLWAAGLWVGAMTSDGDTLVSSATYQGEFLPGLGALDHIREFIEGVPPGLPTNSNCSAGDDDSDGVCDEDFPDGYDNDGDGAVDEDYAVHSQQMYACAYYDTSTRFNQYYADPDLMHEPLNLRVEQRSFAWGQPAVDDFVGVDFKVTNIDSFRTFRNVYLGFMVDADCGPSHFGGATATDDWADYVELDTVYHMPGSYVRPESLHLNIAYMWDDPTGEDGDEALGILGVVVLGHTTDMIGETAPTEVGVHAYRNWSSVGQNPNNDGKRYLYLRGNSDAYPTIDRKGRTADDWRFLISAGPFSELLPGSSVDFQIAIVAGRRNEEFIEYNNEVEKKKFLGTLLTNAIQAQRVYNTNWATCMPPPAPNMRLTPGDCCVMIDWDDYPERMTDPFTGITDFAGYKIWRNVGWDRTSALPDLKDWQVLAEIGREELANYLVGIHGIGRYRYVDREVRNGFPYWYAIVSFDTGEGQYDVYGRPMPMNGSYGQSYELTYPRTNTHRTLDHVRVMPNPYRVDAPWDLDETLFEYSGRRICFQNLPERATIRIYTLAGDLVEILEHNAYGADSETCWNLITRNSQHAVSGVYFYHIESPVGTKLGRLAIIR